MKRASLVVKKKKLGRLSIFFIFLIHCLIFQISTIPLKGSQEKEHKPIVEKVIVTNVEVPVRVLHKGKPVTDLKKEDFVIYENKKKVDINGFFVKHRKIKIDKSNAANAAEGISLGRTFVLAFNVTNYNKYFQKAMDHLFGEILKSGDHIIVFANSTTREYQIAKNLSQIKSQIIEDLKRESKIAKRRLLDYIFKLETNLKVHDFRREVENGIAGFRTARLLADFLHKYLLAWREYKKRYLVPRSDVFYYFARYLEKIKGEKYVLNFYQYEFFPKIRINSETMQKMREIVNLLSNTDDGVLNAQGHLINNQLNQLNADYDLMKGFPNKEISKLFYKVDATFHSFFIKAENPTTLNEFSYRTLASDIENVLKSITDITGGKNITSNDLKNSLDIVSELEDVYYILTYEPLNLKKAGQLKIKVKNKKYEVLYDNNFRADYIKEYFERLEEKIKTPDVRIESFSFKGKILSFTIKDYMMKVVKEKGEKPIGVLKIRIQLKDSGEKSLFDQEKILTAQKNEMSISIPAFKQIKGGEYSFLINVKDLFTGKDGELFEKVKLK